MRFTQGLLHGKYINRQKYDDFKINTRSRNKTNCFHELALKRRIFQEIFIAEFREKQKKITKTKYISSSSS